jgi:hypothetical protein
LLGLQLVQPARLHGSNSKHAGIDILRLSEEYNRDLTPQIATAGILLQPVIQFVPPSADPVQLLRTSGAHYNHNFVCFKGKAVINSCGIA